MQEIVKSESKEIIPFGIDELSSSNIAALKRSCDEMVIGPEGEGYEEVKKVHIRTKKIKTAIKTRHKELKANHLKACQELDEKKRKMNGIIDPIIDLLADKRRPWEDHLAEIEAEKDRKEQERIQKRVDTFAKYNRAIAFFDAAAMTDEEFDKVLNEAIVARAKEKALIAEKERLEKERLEKERLAREAEEKRLAEERAKQEKIAREQAEKEAALKAAQEKIEAEQRAIEEQKRVEQAKKEAAEQALKEEAERKIREKAKQDRLEALKPDREKIIQYANALQSGELIPDVDTDEAEALLIAFDEKLTEPIDWLKREAQAL